ncbi:flagellin N-terminal helical domain-containing protein [Virgibacillus oceani]|uniref:Flagellin n=1 Tax=Virgibacillus oceani TaxID=1479511 RepID=A0A917M281_9BACI|nr:flagellin [Virgibacillus oceani]GGG73171.1 flagellin [Virgibacillus oceani]
MRINHNIAALNTYRQLTGNQANASNSLQKLSSGLRINNAADDAAGLAISEKMRGQIRGLEQAQTNAQDGISMIQTAEGALNETHSILQRMRELATQAANDTNTESDRNEIQKEINQLTSEINRIGNTTEFNTQKLLKGGELTDIAVTEDTASDATAPGTPGVYTFDIGGSVKAGDTITIGNVTLTEGTDFTIGADDNETATAIKDALDNGTTYTAAVTGTEITITEQTASGNAAPEVTIGTGFNATFQVGANEGQSMSIQIDDMRAKALGLTGTAGDPNFTDSNNVTDGTNNTTVEAALDVSTHESAANAITIINDAIEEVSAQRSNLGAYQNRLDHTINNLGTSAENLTAAESRIRDVDMAKEMMAFTKNNILTQAAQAMLAQANQQPQGVLQLLR